MLSKTLLNMFQTIFMWLEFSGEHLKNSYFQCIYIPFNYVRYFIYLYKCNLKLCWTCFKPYSYGWLFQLSINIFPNFIQIHWNNSYYVISIYTKIFIHISNASTILFTYIYHSNSTQKVFQLVFGHRDIWLGNHRILEDQPLFLLLLLISPCMTSSIGHWNTLYCYGNNRVIDLKQYWMFSAQVKASHREQ